MAKLVIKATTEGTRSEMLEAKQCFESGELSFEDIFDEDNVQLMIEVSEDAA